MLLVKLLFVNGVAQETYWLFLSAAVCMAAQLAQETCTRNMRKKLAVKWHASDQNCAL